MPLAAATAAATVVVVAAEDEAATDIEVDGDIVMSLPAAAEEDGVEGGPPTVATFISYSAIISLLTP